MSGATTGQLSAKPAKTDRVDLMQQREQLMLAMLVKKRPIEAIAEALGLDYDQARKMKKTLVERVANFSGNELGSESDVPEGPHLTDDSKRLRQHLGNLLYDMKNRNKVHPVAIAMQTGITQRNQRKASEKPWMYDPSLSQMERIARANNLDFRTMMLRGLLTEAEFNKVMACLNR